MGAPAGDGNDRNCNSFLQQFDIVQLVSNGY